MFTIYTKDEVETFRTPSLFLSWFSEKLERVRLDRSMREDALLHRGQFKEFYEEMFPLFSLLRSKAAEWASSEFKNILGDQSYDVEVKNNHALRYLEIGSTIFDDGERFRMLEFIDIGSVDSIARIERDSNRRPTGLEDTGLPRLRDEMVNERLLLIERVIKKKSAKPYPAGTGLIVYYDDSSIEIDKDSAAMISNFIRDLRDVWEPTFEHVFVIGPNGQHCIEEPRRTPAIREKENQRKVRYRIFELTVEFLPSHPQRTPLRATSLALGYTSIDSEEEAEQVLRNDRTNLVKVLTVKPGIAFPSLDEVQEPVSRRRLETSKYQPFCVIEPFETESI